MSDRCKAGGSSSGRWWGRSAGWLAAALLLVCLAISCERGPLHRVRLLEEPPPGPALMVFYLDRELDEAALKGLVMAEAKAMTPNHPYVEAYVFFDKSFAKKFGSNQTMTRVLETGGTPGSEVLFDPELKTWGGAFMAISPENPLGAWAYFEREPAPIK